MRERDAGLQLVLDEHGREVPGTRSLTDEYQRNLATLPDPESFQLVRLQPILSTSAPADASGKSPVPPP